MDSPKWVPSPEVVAYANVTDAIHQRGLTSYDEFYEWSRADRAGFWEYTTQRLGIVMHQPPTASLDTDRPAEDAVWFPGARLNIVESCFTADPAKEAIRYERGGELHSITYGDMREQANRVANGLADMGIDEGDPVAIAMPMNVEAVIAYLGVLLAGAVVVSIADSFAPHEIATRVRISGADLAITQDVIHRGDKVLPMYEKLVAAGVERAIVIETGVDLELRPTDIGWANFLSENTMFTPVYRTVGDHANILFSSGTTGEPKAIPWTVGSAIKAASDAHYHQDVHPDDVVAWPTNLGWMMGPWLIFSSFINRATMALSQQVPTGTGFIQFIADAGVTVLGVVPSLVAVWRARNAHESADWSGIRVLSSTGEAANAADMAYLMDMAGNKPIIDYIGGTEISGGYMACTVLHPCVPATFTTPTLGGGIHILDDDGNPASSGELFIEPPSMGLSVELLNRDHHEVYYAGTPDIGVPVRRHGDHIEKLAENRFRTTGRVDDAMNLGGIKVGSADIERVVAGTPGIVEAAAIAVEPPGGGPSRLVMCVVAESGATPAELLPRMQTRIRDELNPLFKISDVLLVDALPRTASAKVKRRDLRSDYMNR